MTTKKNIDYLTNDLYKNYGFLKDYSKNQVLFNEGDETIYFYYIESGLIKVSQSTLEGQNVTFFLRKKADYFGILEIILQLPRERFAQCLTDSKLWAIKKETFFDLTKKNPELKDAFLQIVSQRLLQTQKNIGMLISKPVPWRLAWLLNQFSETNYSNNKERFIQNPLTHEEISNIIGCSRQTVSEILNKWQNDNLIYYKNKLIVIYDLCKLFTHK